MSAKTTLYLLASALLLALSPASQEWGTYLGGSSHERPWPHSMAVTASGEVVVAGVTASPDFPTRGALQGYGGGNAWGDGYLSCLAAGGATLSWSTYLGGSGDDEIRGVAVAANGDVVVCGWTDSMDFPTTPGCFQPNHNGGSDAFVARLAWNGQTLVAVWATYLGAAGNEAADAIAVLPSGDVVVAGGTGSSSFPIRMPAYQASFGGGQLDGFVAVLSADGARLVASTFAGGSGLDLLRDLDVDSSGRVAVAGITDSVGFPAGAMRHGPAGLSDAFVLCLDAGLASTACAVRIGGTGPEHLNAIVVAPDGRIGIAGWTGSASFPTTTGPAYAGGWWDAFVALVDPATSGLPWSRLFGGSGSEGAHDLLVDASGLVTIVGETDSTDLPLPSVFHPGCRGGPSDGFLARFDPNARIADVLYAGHVGGTGDDRAYAIAVTKGGVFVAGSATAGFPATPGSFDPTYNGDPWDTFVASVELLPGGARRHGSSTGGCRPVESGLAAFGGPCIPIPMPPWCIFPYLAHCFASGAPPSTPAACFFGFPSARRLPVINVDLLVDPIVTSWGTQTDATGFASVGLGSVVPSPGTNGVAVQWAFLTNAACPGTGPLAASDAIVF